MALEMKTHKDIAAFEAKPMFGRTWRQLAALAIMFVGGGAVFFAVATVALVLAGTSWDVAIAATLDGAGRPAAEALSTAGTAGMWAMFPVIVPVAFWAWARPMGINPEEYAQYYFRHQLTSKVINYEDTYAHVPAERVGLNAGEPVSVDAGTHGPSQQPAGRKRRSPARPRRSPSERPEGPPRRARGGR